MAIDLGYGGADLGAIDLGADSELGFWPRGAARIQRASPQAQQRVAALRQQLAQRAAASSELSMSRLASATQALPAERIARMFEVNADVSDGATTGSGTNRPEAGLNPRSMAIVSFAAAGAPAAGVDLVDSIRVADRDMVLGAASVPVAALAPDSFNLKASFPTLTSATPVVLRVSRTVAPGVGTTQRTSMVLFGDSVT